MTFYLKCDIDWDSLNTSEGVERGESLKDGERQEDGAVPLGEDDGAAAAPVQGGGRGRGWRGGGRGGGHGAADQAADTAGGGARGHQAAAPRAGAGEQAAGQRWVIAIPRPVSNVYGILVPFEMFRFYYEFLLIFNS